MLDQEVRRWTASDAAELYDIARWGKGYFSVDENGHVLLVAADQEVLTKSVMT